MKNNLYGPFDEETLEILSFLANRLQLPNRLIELNVRISHKDFITVECSFFTDDTAEETKSIVYNPIRMETDQTWH
jgi:hypothetical protein